MLLHRHVVAALVTAALNPVGAAWSDPTGQPLAPGDATAAAASFPMGYYRRESAADGAQRAIFGMTATMAPAVAPGTTAWLSRRALEPLASSYASPDPARKEVGISYSSDGRLNAYLAQRDHATPAGAPRAASDDCCSPDPLALPPGTQQAKGIESPGVASLLGQLRTKGLKLSLDDGWKLTAGARSREYSNSFLNSRVGHITLQRWWGDWTTAYSMQLEKRGGWGNLAPGQSFQLGYALAPRSTVGVAYTMGHEFAFFGTQGMLNTQVRSLALQAEHAVEKDWSVRFDAGYYDHGALPSQKAIRFAFRRSL